MEKTMEIYCHLIKRNARLPELKGEINNLTKTFGDFNTPISNR